MSMSVGPAEGEEEGLNSSINTTPLVDVMLVLLIIFLITVPAILKTVPVVLPNEANVPTQTKPENVIIAIDKEGNTYWNDRLLPDYQVLLGRIKEVAVLDPQPEVHIRADKGVRYEFVGRVVVVCQRGGIQKIGFITEPPPRGG